MAREIRTQFIPTMKLIPYSEQVESLGPDFLYTSYGVTWLGERIPGFMDKEVIAVPFKPFDPDSGQDSSPDQDNETWTALTRVYHTRLDRAP